MINNKNIDVFSQTQNFQMCCKGTKKFSICQLFPKKNIILPNLKQKKLKQQKTKTTKNKKNQQKLETSNRLPIAVYRNSSQSAEQILV
ncbi:MAG: hypothetical protein LBR18_08240 [Tannerella sp.]|jgi:hypothetical protein|nr:hypothetical protein [Tannerella sp.]